MNRQESTISIKGAAIALIRERRGTIRTTEAIRAGIHPRTLYELRDTGELIPLSRGVYRLADMPFIANIDLATIATRIPRAVVCLVSALAYHGITTQVPHVVSIALEKGAETPRLAFPPITVHRFSGDRLTKGVQEHIVDDIQVRVYNAEKTLADCFRYRNKIGVDVVLEAIKLYKARKPVDVGELLKYARICGVEKIMRPYIEVLL